MECKLSNDVKLTKAHTKENYAIPAEVTVHKTAHCTLTQLLSKQHMAHNYTNLPEQAGSNYTSPVTQTRSACSQHLGPSHLYLLCPTHNLVGTLVDGTHGCCDAPPHLRHPLAPPQVKVVATSSPSGCYLHPVVPAAPVIQAPVAHVSHDA